MADRFPNLDEMSDPVIARLEHEVRRPSTIILAYAQYLRRHSQRGTLSSDLVELSVATIESAVQRMADLATEISARAQAEAALRESETRYRTIIEEAIDYAIFACNHEDRITSWSPGAEAVFGWTAEEAIGQPASITFTLEDQAAGVPEEEFSSARDQGHAPNVRWHQRKDGQRVFIQGTSYGVFDESGQFRGVFKIGQDVTERRRIETALRDSEASLQQRVEESTAELRALSRRLIRVQEEERRFLANELHDEIGQTLTGLGLQLTSGVATDATRLSGAQKIVAALTDQVRQLSMDLRPSALDRYGLVPALRWQFERYQTQTGVQVAFSYEGLDRRFDASIEIAAYRIVQEALTNVARHAATDQAVVQVFADEEAITISIRDHGDGAILTTDVLGGGLDGMRERAELLGGTLTVDATPGGGVTVIAELPIGSEQTENDQPRART